MTDTLSYDAPFDQFDAWLADASRSEINDPNAMTLATVDADGMPNARIVLLKGHGQDGFRFFTNYNSTKGQELTVSGKAALVFHWKTRERQVRVQGLIERLSAEDSDAYYQSRPRGSRIGAWASDQSKPLPGGVPTLHAAVAEQEQVFDGVENPPRPPHWGGFLLRPLEIEFWQAGEFRIHERHRWTRQNVDAVDGWSGGPLWP